MKSIIVGIMVCAGTLHAAEKKEKPPRVTTSQMEELFADPKEKAAVLEIIEKSKKAAQERKKERAEERAAKLVFARKPRAKTLPATRSALDALKNKKSATPPSPSATTDVPVEDTAIGGRPELFSNMGWKQN